MRDGKRQSFEQVYWRPGIKPHRPQHPSDFIAKYNAFAFGNKVGTVDAQDSCRALRGANETGRNSDVPVAGRPHASGQKKTLLTIGKRERFGGGGGRETLLEFGNVPAFQLVEADWHLLDEDLPPLVAVRIF
jgi:hypothetical protein